MGSFFPVKFRNMVSPAAPVSNLCKFSLQKYLFLLCFASPILSRHSSLVPRLHLVFRHLQYGGGGGGGGGGGEAGEGLVRLYKHKVHLC